MAAVVFLPRLFSSPEPSQTALFSAVCQRCFPLVVPHTASKLVLCMMSAAVITALRAERRKRMLSFVAFLVEFGFILARLLVKTTSSTE